MGFLVLWLYKMRRVACACCAHQSYRVYKIPQIADVGNKHRQREKVGGFYGMKEKRRKPL
jgi:hypothetical protein